MKCFNEGLEIEKMIYGNKHAIVAFSLNKYFFYFSPQINKFLLVFNMFNIIDN